MQGLEITPGTTSLFESLPALATIFLAALINATLQLGLGSLLLLYHSSLTRHISKRTKKLTGAFTAAFAAMTFLLLASAVFVLQNTIKTLPPDLLGGFVGALVALSILAILFYYRRSGKDSTELWIPKFVSNTLTARAKKADTATEAFSLGLTACLAELPFTFVLIILAGNALLSLSPWAQLLAIMVYVLINVLPLLIFRLAIKNHRTVVEVQKWRVENKTFLRLISGVGYLVLGLFLWAFKVLGGAA